MVPILACSILALGIVVERSWTLRRRAVLPPGLAEEVRNLALARKLDAQHLADLERSSPLGAVFAGALAVRHQGRDAVRERVEDTGRHVMHDMDRFLPTLGTIALISPLLGLLGTVFGLIDMFLSIMGHGIGDANHMAGGIGEALVCTAAGLTVAIPAYVIHRAYRARVTGYGIALERAVLKLLDEIDAAPQSTPGVQATPRRATR